MRADSSRDVVVAATVELAPSPRPSLRQATTHSGSSHSQHSLSQPSSSSPSSTTPDTEGGGNVTSAATSSEVEEEPPPPPVAARPERTKSIVSISFHTILQTFVTFEF